MKLPSNSPSVHPKSSIVSNFHLNIKLSVVVSPFYLLAGTKTLLARRETIYFPPETTQSSLLAPLTSKSADFYEIIRPKGAEKKAVSLRNGP